MGQYVALRAGFHRWIVKQLIHALRGGQAALRKSAELTQAPRGLNHLGAQQDEHEELSRQKPRRVAGINSQPDDGHSRNQPHPGKRDGRPTLDTEDLLDITFVVRTETLLLGVLGTVTFDRGV